MAVIDKKVEDGLYKLAIKVLSKYDINDPDVQKFIFSVTGGINFKKANSSVRGSQSPSTDNPKTLETLLTLDQKSKTLFEKILNKEAVTQETANNDDSPLIKAFEKLTKSLTDRKILPQAFAPPVDKNQTSIFKDIFKQRDLFGMGYELFKKRTSPDPDKKDSSYFQDLFKSFKEKGFGGLGREVFSSRNLSQSPTQTTDDQQTQILKLLSPSLTSTQKPLLGPSFKEDNQQTQELDLLKEETSIQTMLLGGFTQNGKDALKDILTDVLSNPALSSPNQPPVQSTNQESNQGLDLMSLLGLKQLFRPSSRRTTTRPSSRPVRRPSNKRSAPAPRSKKTSPRSPSPQVTSPTPLPSPKPPTPPSSASSSPTRRATTKAAEKATTKTTEKAVEKAAVKTAEKTAAKGVGKAVLKKIPLVGLAAGGIFAAQRAFEGDWAGAGLELASGAASTLPGVGTAASLGIDAALMAKDVYTPPQAAEQTTSPPEIPQTPSLSLPSPEEVPQNWTPITPPSPPAAIPSSPQPDTIQTNATNNNDTILQQIALNTEKTNTQISSLSQAILKLASVLSQTTNSKPISPQMVINSPPPPQLPPAADVANNNVDPIRLVRSKFAV